MCLRYGSNNKVEVVGVPGCNPNLLHRLVVLVSPHGVVRNLDKLFPLLRSHIQNLKQEFFVSHRGGVSGTNV